MAALFAILAAVGWGTSDYAAGSASRRSSAVSVVVLTHFTAVVALLWVAVDFGPFVSSIVELARPDRTDAASFAWPRLAGDPTAADIAWGVVAGLGGGFGAMLLFRGLGRGSMAVVAPITAAGAASVPVVFGLLSGESLAPTGFAGIALALAAIVLVSLVPAETDGMVDGTVDGDDGDDDGTTLTVPEGWAEEYGLDPLPGPVADDLIFPGPAPATTMVAPVEAEVRALPVADVRVPALASELGLTVRSLLGVTVTLLVALVIAAAGIAAGPVAALASGDRPTAGHLVMLGFALATAAVALSGLRYAAPLVRIATGLGEPGLGMAGGMVGGTASDARVAVRVPAWRRILGQPGIPEALLSGLGFGTFYVCISRASATAGHWPMVSARGVSVLLFTVVALATSTAVLPARGSRRFVVLAGVLDGAAAVLFVLATNAGLLSIGAVLASLYPAVTVLLARWHGKERIAPRQLAGLCLALGAVALLAV